MHANYRFGKIEILGWRKEEKENEEERMHHRQDTA